MKASYVSTGGGGTDYEVDLAAALLARLLAGGRDSVLLPDLEPASLFLQHRSGPLGFDDFTVEADLPDGTPAVAWLQAKRAYSLGDTEDFRALVSSIWSHLQTNQGAWTATIVAGSVSPDLADIDTLLQSARTQDDWETFEKVWSAKGVLNASKRTFLAAVGKAMEGKPAHARYEVLRRLRVAVADFDVSASLSRQAATDLLAGELADPSIAASLFAELRSAALRDGKLAGSFTRPSLLAALPAHYQLLPSRRLRAGIATLEVTGRESLASIMSHIGPRDETPAGLSLVRDELMRQGRRLLDDAGTLRIVGEGGAGKSAVLRRLAERFDGRVLVLKDDRVDGRSWPAFASQLGLDLSAAEVAVEFASRGRCLLAIDGADRLLLSERRPIVEDLLAAIAASPLRGRWSFVASARDFQSRDVVAEALTAVGLPMGGRIVVAGLDIEDVRAIGEALPTLATVATRSDLRDRNRILFLLREMLATPHLGATATEVDFANAWATRGGSATPPDPRRDRALAEIGELLLTRPARRPGRADLDPEGLLGLQREEAVHFPPGRDAILLSHDVHEDWILARTFLSHRTELPTLLRAAHEPLVWLRAMRVYGQALLEQSPGSSGWLDAMTQFDAEPDLDPAWLRSLMTAPFYSERSADVLDALEPAMLADDGKLLIRLIETLLISEWRLEEDGDSAGSSQRQLRAPVLQSWLAFIRWSVGKWRSWPVAAVALLAEVAQKWCRFTQGFEAPIIKAVVQASLSLLIEIEDSEHPEKWDDRHKPFADTEYRDWSKPERLLRNAVARGAAAAPDDVRSYLERLTSNARLRGAAADLIERHGQIPVALPKPYTDLLIAHLTPRQRRPRYENRIAYSDCFDSYHYHDAGIRHETGFFPPAPDRAGFAAIFAQDEAEGLRLFHRLEMRASVYLRNYWRRREGRPQRPVLVPTPWDDFPLWGNAFEYQWSRGVLGSHVLGSCYLALDDWISAQLDGGRPIEELCRLILQRNGLVATAAPLICCIALRLDKPGMIDAAAPFLAAPRLWDYDCRRFVALQAHEQPIWLMPRDLHFRAADVSWQRWRQRMFLDRDLLLSFHVQATDDAKALLERARQGWATADLATHDDELMNSVCIRDFEERLARIRSDADPANISMERVSERSVKVWIYPPAEQRAKVAQIEQERQEVGRVAGLMNWVIASERDGTLDSRMTLIQAIEQAKEIQGLLEPDAETADLGSFQRMTAPAAIVGTAWLAARFGPDTLLDRDGDWITETIIDGCATLESAERDGMLVDDAILSWNPLFYGARGVAALLARGRNSPDLLAWAKLIAHCRLIKASTALVAELDWKRRTREAWDLAVIALDRSIHRYVRPWQADQEREAARVERANHRLSRRSLGRWVFPWTGPRLPRLPKPIARRGVYRTRRGRWPFAVGMVRTGWSFDYTRVGNLLAVADMDAVIADPVLAGRLEGYLLRLLAWTRARWDSGRDEFGEGLPYELGAILATALGRYAAAGGSIHLWQGLIGFSGHGRDPSYGMVGDYLEAVTRELIDSERAPDERFWRARRGAADWLFANYGRSQDENVEEDAATAGLMGRYITPLPPGWPHLEAVLPEIDRWAQVACGSAPAAHRLVVFAERLDLAQRRHWLLRWAALMAEQNKRDRGFWGYGEIGDKLALLLEPLATTDADIRREVRRLVSVIADSGSVVARESLARLAGQRGSD